ncbi:hypothetical protein [Natrarchaeobaculum aegyptiacum]|uniref:hypothetical protein n=1 Tax=Natrarchaeobaculum aegyptiacum TaxID=745377 RepID=UPI001E465763|nr:hypothetical protein [Natrarchaeobaculum aegyptiacum]
MVRFQHILIPVASEEDARTTCAALQPYLDDIERVTAVHVIEKAQGAPDKAPLEKRRNDAAEYLQYLTKRPCQLGLKPQFHPDR